MFINKKIFFCLAALFCLFLAVGCQEQTGELPPAAPVLKQYTLVYSTAGNGSIEGVATQAVNHNGDGSEVTAVPAAGFHFVNWSDGVSTPSRTDLGVMADLEVKAHFTINQYNLVYTAGENGSIKGVSVQKVDHGGSGSPVTAIPAKGYHFKNWNDGLTIPNRTASGVTADLELTAIFAANQYTLTYAAGKNGAIDGAGSQTVVHNSNGAPVTAVPAEHYYFSGWSDGVSTASRTYLNVMADLEVTANFSIYQYSLSYTAEENGSIKGAGVQKVDHGDSGSPVTAMPAKGYHFTGWSDGLSTASRTDSAVSADLALTAAFAINRYALVFSAGEHGSIDGSDRQTVIHGDTASPVQAVADKGYHFVKWSDGEPSAQRLETEVAGDLRVSALFEVNTYTIGGTVSGLLANTQLVLQNRTNDDLTITANGDFRFLAELANADVYDVKVRTQPTSPEQTCTVSHGTGTVQDTNVNNIAVNCVPNTYKIGGTITGLPEGDKVVMQNNGEDDLIIRANGAFSFDIALDDGSSYVVEVLDHPLKPNWICMVENSSGSLSGRDVNDIIVNCYPEVVLQATAGIRKIALQWNDYDFSDATFNLCIAREDSPIGEIGSCEELTGGVIEAKVSSPVTITELINDMPYWLQLEALKENGTQTLSKVVMAIPFGGLNDSGIDWCADDNTNHNIDGTWAQKSANCSNLAPSHPGQDGTHGRDAAAGSRNLAKTGHGPAGFDFTRLCMSGDAAGENECPPKPSPGSAPNNWACIRDNVTGLSWEVKTDSGLRNRNSTYTWYNPDTSVNGGYAGMKNGGKCEESDCDTQAYIQAVNERGLCGAGDWRLPTKRELLSIVDNSRFKPAVDRRFFPKTQPLYYWSSSTYAEEANSAWQVYYLYGEASPDDKNKNFYIRLVRGRTVTFGLENP